MIRASSASKKSRLQAGYALVPVNATTRAFLAQFATSLVDLPSDFSAELLPSPTSLKKTKKRASHDEFASRAPVNKKKRGAGQQQSTKTDKLKAPLSVDAGRKMTVPRKKAATIARVREESSLLPKFWRLLLNRRVGKNIATMIKCCNYGQKLLIPVCSSKPGLFPSIAGFYRWLPVVPL